MRKPLAILGLLAALGASVLVAVTIGPADIGVADVWSVVVHHVTGGAPAASTTIDSIVWELRIPRVLTAACVGAGLGIAGAVMQSLLHNPMADPYLLGVSSGASVGAVASVLIGLSIAMPVAAFLGAIVALILTLVTAQTAGSISPTRTVLAGLAIAQLGSALTSLIVFWSAQGDSFREILSWLLGSLASSSWTSVAIGGSVVLVATLILYMQSPLLDAFALSDDAVAALGANVTRARWLLLVLVAVVTGVLVSISGAIGFVGLILPHMVRFLVGAKHQVLLPTVALGGAVFLIWADTAARTVFDPRELPVGIVTAIIGVPLFILLFRRNRGGQWTLS